VRKLLFVFALLVPAVSQAWWNNDWNFRKEITLDLSATGANISESLNDVPVLLRLHAGNFPYFADAKPDGSDLRIVAGDDKSPLQFHVERFDSTNQLAFIWVRLPQLAAGVKDAKIFVYYGNTKIGAGADAKASFDANQSLVLHLSEAQGLPQDSTANGNNATASTAELTPASLIGGGLKFETGRTLTVAASSSLRLTPSKGITITAWVKPTGPQTDAYVAALEDANGSVTLGLDGSAARARFTKTGTAPITIKGTDLTVDAWHHLALEVNGSKLTLYVDGVAEGDAAITPTEIAGTLTLGGSMAGGHSYFGELDEVGVAGVPRPIGFLQAAARSQGVQAPLVVYGADAQRESGGTSYFATTMKNVTPDGWVVIGILAVMFVIAIMIIVGKAIYLQRVATGDKAFLKQFQKLQGDPTALDHEEDDDGDDALDQSALAPSAAGADDQYGMSVLYRLYHHGVQEMTRRVNFKKNAAQAGTASQPITLTPQAIAAIRATMDATLVRLNQRLQSQMVLLTIAIAGGPFLGLLGTVVGVMITFAAIAASGDVNVNAIAPGIAAALAATVAGLAVAIPALFAYNWLNTRIKGMTADMRVFVDEFITRVAEHYS
jgi:biopolymer transport protein ExbB